MSFGQTQEEKEPSHHASPSSPQVPIKDEIPSATLKRKQSVQHNINTILKHHTINFHPNTTVVTNESKPVVQKLVEILLANPDINVSVDGHCKMSNLSRRKPKKRKQALLLSQDRADSIVSVIVEAGVNPDRMIAKGYGVSRPLPQGQNDMRVEVKVLGLPPAQKAERKMYHHRHPPQLQTKCNPLLLHLKEQNLCSKKLMCRKT